MVYDVCYEILYYEDDQNYAFKGYGMPFSDLDAKLLDYHKSIGFDAYKASSVNPQDSVVWRLNGNWYHSL